jgi:hypothetical protein
MDNPVRRIACDGGPAPSTLRAVTVSAPAPSPESLRPRPDGGASLLFVGGSRAERARHVDELAHALAALAAPPLVVHLRPGDSPSQDVVGRIHDAVESALTRARAPGGLYDDRGGGLLRHLGGWIFRARTVGHPGLVIVVDELQRQVDRRGRRDDDGASAELSALLASCAGRALTVVASVPASSASGAPALAAALCDGFTKQVNLGAPPTVTRDPSTLVTALAGRSFGPDALTRAIFGWLDLPDPTDDRVDDDTVVVFSSPLTPPLVPEPAALEWSSAAEAPASTPSIPPSAAPVDADEIQRWRSVLSASVRVAALLPEARALRSHPPADRDAFLARFLAGPMHLPWLRDVLARGSSLGEPSARMKLATRAALAEVRAAWSSVRGEPDDATRWSARLRQVAEDEGARASAWWLLPGLRVDLMARLEARVLSPLGFKRIDGGVTRSLAAASTVAPASSRVALGGSEATRLATYAMALGEPGSLEDAALRAEQNALAAMRSYAGGFVGRTAVLLMADVGAAEPDLALEARPLGGECPFAELVPWGLYTFGGNEP